MATRWRSPPERRSGRCSSRFASPTAASIFRAPEFDRLRGGLYGKTGTAPSGPDGQATAWFTGWIEPGSMPGQTRRLAFAAFVSRSEATGGEHAAPVVAALSP